MEFLGVILDSVNTTIKLPREKNLRIRSLGRPLLNKKTTSIHDLASFIGLVVFAGIAVSQALLRYKYLEIVISMTFIRSKGEYNTHICLDEHSRDLITWWVENVHYLYHSVSII